MTLHIEANYLGHTPLSAAIAEVAKVSAEASAFSTTTSTKCILLSKPRPALTIAQKSGHTSKELVGEVAS